MAKRFHVNPETGKSGRCRATGSRNSCPFSGDSGGDNHYDTPQEAKAAGEALMANRYGEVALVSATKAELAPTADSTVELMGALGDLNPNANSIGDNERYIEVISQLTDEDYRKSLKDPIDTDALGLGSDRENIVRELEVRVITSTVKDSYDYLKTVALSDAPEQERSEEIDFFVKNYETIQDRARVRGIELPDIPEGRFKAATITGRDIKALKDSF